MVSGHYTITNQIGISMGSVGVDHAVISVATYRHTINLTYASCIDCCIDKSSGTHTGTNLVSDKGGCGCMLQVQPTPTCTVAVVPLAHMVVITHCIPTERNQCLSWVVSPQLVF